MILLLLIRLISSQWNQDFAAQYLHVEVVCRLDRRKTKVINLKAHFLQLSAVDRASAALNGQLNDWLLKRIHFDYIAIIKDQFTEALFSWRFFLG